MGSLRKSIYLTMNAGFQGKLPSKIFDLFITSLIILNLGLIVIIEEAAQLSSTSLNWIYILEWLILFIFGMEYFIRVWCCVEDKYFKKEGELDSRTRIRYIFSLASIIDFLAFFPFVVLFLINYSYSDNIFSIDIRVIKTLQLIRILKLMRVFGYLQLIIEVLALNLASFIGAMIVMLNLLLMASLGIYLFERDIQPESFGSMPKALWWSMVTLTTIGYGDAVPITTGGKIFTFIFALISMGIVGIPISIVTASLQEQVSKKRKMREFIQHLYTYDQTENIREKVLEYAGNIEIKPKAALGMLSFAESKYEEAGGLSREVPEIVEISTTMRCPHCFEDIFIQSHYKKKN